MVGSTLHIVHGMVEAELPAPPLKVRGIGLEALKMKMLSPNKICAVVAAPDAKGMRMQLKKALRLTRMAEFRLDWLSDDSQIRTFLRYLATSRPPAMLIATCRRRAAGGQSAVRLPAS